MTSLPFVVRLSYYSIRATKTINKKTNSTKAIEQVYYGKNKYIKFSDIVFQVHIYYTKKFFKSQLHAAG